MTFAIVSDIHANIEALRAVVSDIQSRDIEKTICLGDIIGYGPNPRETTTFALNNFDFSLKGNHEEAVLFEPVGFNETATISAEWTREQLSNFEDNPDEDHTLWNFLGNLPPQKTKEEMAFVHASPIEPTSQYLFPDDIQDHSLMNRIFELIPHVGFGGHTHVPGIFEEDPHNFMHPTEIERTYQIQEHKKAFINVGSVGQPRDGITDACYVIIHQDQTVEFRRISYNVKQTAQKLFEEEELPNSLGKRLLEGK